MCMSLSRHACAPRKVATVLGSKVAKQLFHQVPALFQDLDRDIHMPPLRDAHSTAPVSAYKIIQEGRKILHFLFVTESYTETEKEVHHDGE